MDRNNQIKDAIKSKFGTSLDKLDLKQVHSLNQNHLYTPKQLSNKINASYQSQVKLDDQKISDNHDNLDRSVMAGYGKDPKYIEGINKAKEEKQYYGVWRRGMIKPINQHKDDALVYRNPKTFALSIATPKQINSIKTDKEQLKIGSKPQLNKPQVNKQKIHNQPKIKVGSNPGNPLNPHSKTHKIYMRIRNDPKKLQEHRRRVRAFDNTNSHRLGNRLYYIKTMMHKPNSKYYVGKNTNITPMEVLKQVQEKKHTKSPIRRTQTKSKAKHVDINQETLEDNQPKKEPSLEDVIKAHMESPQR